MSKFLKLYGLCLTTAALLSACGPEGRQSEATDSSAKQAPVEQTAPSLPVDRRTPDVDFAVSPATMPGCGETSPLQAEISWQVRNTAVAEVRVEVADPGQENWKVLSVAGRQGEVETGPWVLNGTRFRLIYSSTGEQLASHQMTEGACVNDDAD